MTASVGSPQVFKVLVDDSGNVIIAGNFNQVGSVTSPYVARLLDSGSLDGNFTLGTGPSTLAQAAMLQADGKLLIGGSFTSVNGTAVNSLARMCPVAVLTIIDNDSSVGFSASAYSVNEGGVNQEITFAELELCRHDEGLPCTSLERVEVVGSG